MSTPSPTYECDDSGFEFHSGWSYTGIIIVILCGLYVFIDAIRHKEKRQVPGKLMIARTMVDLLWAILFFYMILRIDCKKIRNDPNTCEAFGTCFIFLFLLSSMYFAGICWDMYFTLVNPFRKPLSDSWQLHLFSIIVSLVLVLIVFANHGYKYRKDYQICWTKNTSTTTSPNNLIILYIPLGAVIFGGLAITFWAVRRLRQRMLQETFELRWSVIKRQIAIVSFFTINYVIAGCIWWPVVWITFDSDEYNEYGADPNKNQPYLLSITIILTVVFDVVAWIAKESFESCQLFKNPIKGIISSSNYIGNGSNNNTIIEYNITTTTRTTTHGSTPKSSYDKSFNATNRDEKSEPLLLNQSNSNNPSQHSSLHYTLNTSQGNSLIGSQMNTSNSSIITKTTHKQIKPMVKKSPNLSNALRREVIVFITHGLAQAIKRTAKETQQTQNNNNLDVWDADFDQDHIYSNNRSMTNRKSNKSNPELQS